MKKNIIERIETTNRSATVQCHISENNCLGNVQLKLVATKFRIHKSLLIYRNDRSEMNSKINKNSIWKYKTNLFHNMTIA